MQHTVYNKSICMLSCKHSALDDRIYWKEALTLKQAGYQVTHIAVASTEADYISAEGIHIIQVPEKKYSENRYINKVLRIFFNKRDYKSAILKSAIKTRSLFYHFHDFQLLSLGKTLKEKLGHAILIYDVHELREKMLFDHPGKLLLPVNYIYSKITARNEIQDIRHFDGIIAISEILAEKYKLLRPHISATSIYNYSYFKSVTSHAGGLAKNYDVIYSGTVSKLRGIIEIVEAVRLLKEQLPKIKVLIIGSFTSNALKEKTNKQIIFYKLSENLILHDQVPFNEIADYYNQSKIGLCIFQPVNIFRNALFIKTFEYMAFGLPIVGSNFGNIARYIQYDEIGICVNPLNPVEISNAILKILHTPTLFDKYSSNGKKAVNEKYNWQAEEPKLIGFYEALLPEEK